MNPIPEDGLHFYRISHVLNIDPSPDKVNVLIRWLESKVNYENGLMEEIRSGKIDPPPADVFVWKQNELEIYTKLLEELKRVTKSSEV